MRSSLTVFVCSTFADLGAERDGVLDAIRRLKLQHDSMEFFGARTGQPIETCLAEVRQSNVIVVIVGHRYGTLVPGMHISFSQAEYDEAYRLKKPCLVYIRSDDVPVLPRHIERDPDSLRLLEEWKSLLRTRHTVAPFDAPMDLAVKVTADLSRTITSLNDADEVVGARNQESSSLWDTIRAVVDEAQRSGLSDFDIAEAVRRGVFALISRQTDAPTTVFLSYAPPDRAIVRRFAERLRELGINVWMDEAKLVAGVDWPAEIQNALESAQFVVFFLSPASAESKWAQNEIKLAIRKRVSGTPGPILVPVLLETTTEVPPLLRDIQWIDLRDGDIDRGVERLIQAIGHHQPNA